LTQQFSQQGHLHTACKPQQELLLFIDQASPTSSWTSSSGTNLLQEDQVCTFNDSF
jgi:hypothetical protein